MERDPNMLLMEFFETVYRPLRLLIATKGTVEQYRIAIRAFDRFLCRPATLTDLTEEHATAFMASILGEGRSVVTANMKASTLKTLARLAKRKKYIAEDLSDVDKLKAPRRLPTAWSQADMEKIIHSCGVTEGLIAGVRANAWWTAFVLLAYDTGLRRRAILTIRLDELDFERGLLRVPAENMKTAVEQVFKLHPQTIEAILASVPPDRELLFPMHYKHARCFYVRFKTILKRAGLPATSRDMVHKLRRTCASHIADKAGEALAIKQLGHLDPSCIKRYVDPTFTATHDVVGMLPRPAWDNPREVTVVRNEGAVYHLGEPLKIVLPGDGLGHAGAIDRILASNELTPADIRQAIAEMGMSVQWFCEQAKIGKAHLYRVLSEERPLTRDMERRIRIALGLGPRPKYTPRPRIAPEERPNVAPPPDTRPDEHPLLDAEPFSLIPEFVDERLAGSQSAHYVRQIKNCLRSVLTLDGAIRVRDLELESTLIQVLRMEADGDISADTAARYRAAARLFVRWLVEQRSVYFFNRLLPRLDWRLTRATRRLLARLDGAS